MRMNKNIALILVLSTFGVVLSQQLSYSCSPNDNGNYNAAYLKFLESKKITLVPTPVIDAKACGGLFAIDGSCCNIASAREYIVFTNSIFIAKWKKYLIKVGNIKRLMPALRKIQAKLTLTDVKNKKTLLKNKDNSAVFTKVLPMIPDTQEELDLISNGIKNFDANLQTFKTQGRTCFDAIKTARANSICALCSSKAGNYSSSTGSTLKIRVPMESCSSIINACYPVWKFNFELAATMQYINLLRATKAKANLQVKFQNMVSPSDEDVGKMKNALSRCKLEVKEGTTTPSLTCNITGTAESIDSLKTNICQNFFSANKLNSLSEGDENVDEDIQDSEVTAAESEMTTVSTRLLQQAATTTDPKEPTSSDPNLIMEPIVPATATTTTTTTPTPTTFGSLTASNDMTPGDTADTSTAGDSTGKSAKLVLIGYALFMISAMIALF